MPLILWLNGGPGASSLLGLLAEHGPFHTNDYSEIVANHSQTDNDNPVPVLFYNNYTWTKVSHVLYLESPAGVGYSFCGDTDTTDADVDVDVEVDVLDCPHWNDSLVASDNYEIVVQFFKAFPEYQTNPFYITGESYGGIYVPTLVMQIEHHQNTNSYVCSYLSVCLVCVIDSLYVTCNVMYC